MFCLFAFVIKNLFCYIVYIFFRENVVKIIDKYFPLIFFVD